MASDALSSNVPNSEALAALAVRDNAGRAGEGAVDLGKQRGAGLAQGSRTRRT